jgi:outer membrane protein OmpA-like peptidoglycan-associated protein
VPDAINPVSWIEDDEEKAAEPDPRAAEMDKKVAEAKEKDFPTLERIPEGSLKAGTPATSGGGLGGDGAGRKYASEPVMRQGDAVSALDGDGVAALEKRAAEQQARTQAPAMAPAETVAPMGQQTASLPPSTAKPMTVMEAYQAALSQTRPNPQGGAMDTYATGGGIGGDHGTVVIGGDGIQGGASTMPSPMAGVPGLPSAGMVRIATIQFGDGASGLDTNDREVLRQVRSLHRQHGGRLVVVGHSSSRTRTMDLAEHQRVNQRLSGLRAQAVARELASLGVPEGSISTEARGAAEPIFHEVMPSGEAGNRRAEVFLAY